MINRIAEQVQKWLGKFIDQSLIKFDIFANDLEFKFLSSGLGKVTHHALKPVKHWPDWNHARGKNTPLKTGRCPPKVILDNSKIIQKLGTRFNSQDIVLQFLQIDQKRSQIRRGIFHLHRIKDRFQFFGNSIVSEKLLEGIHQPG